MPSFRRQFTIAAGGRLDNAIAGSEFEFPDRPSAVGVLITQTTASTGVAAATIQFGAEVQLNSGNVPTEIGAGQGPRPGDQGFVVSDVATTQDRIIIQVDETGGANPVTVDVLAQFTPLG